jgi:hypothetical protein
MSKRKTKQNFVGPHEGRELELMLSGKKPLSMFVEPVDSEFEYFPEEEFDSWATKGKLVKRVSLEPIVDPHGNDSKIRRVLYARPEELWRIDAVLLVQKLYDSLSPGWRPDFERIIGLLLGYNRADIESYIDSMAARNRATQSE